MFGLGYQELLLILIILGIFLLLNPAVFYIIVVVVQKLAGPSPRRVLVALWLIGTGILVAREADLNGTLASFIILAVAGGFLIACQVALEFAWLWLMGCLWQRFGLSGIGTKWRDMAALHLRAVRGVGKDTAA